jgi:hypothetical protein
VRGSITRRNSTGELGQPWVTSSGRAAGFEERMCRKWMSRPLMLVMNCGTWFSLASWWRQSKPSAQ